MKDLRLCVTIPGTAKSQSLLHRAEGARVGIAVTFPGQGSQSAGMGALWQHTPQWRLVTHAEEVLGHEVAPLLLDTDSSRLRHTREAQVAVFLTSLLAWEST